MSRSRMAKAKATIRVPEKSEQAHGVQLLRTLGANVYVLGHPRPKGDFPGTGQTPGLPDVLAFLRPRLAGHWAGAPRTLLVWECKATGGRLRPEQREFQQLCGDADVCHVVGNFNALIEWLIEGDWLAPDAVAHYRVTR